MKSIGINATCKIEGNIKDIFQYIVPINLSLIFKRVGLVPGVKSTSNIEKWYKSGMTRNVVFDDNSTAVETLTEVTEPTSFTYRIINFSSIMKYIIVRIDGKWNFAEKGNITEINWEYILTPRNFASPLIIQFLVKPSMQSVLSNALKIIENSYREKSKRNI